jgi:hypothetical protein
MTPVVGPSAWTTASLARQASWLTELSEEQRESCITATRRALRSRTPLEKWSQEDFTLSSLQAPIDRWRRILDRGRGFVVVRGVPVNEMSIEESEAFFWGLGVLIGAPGAQNTRGDLLGHVRDLHEEDPGRLYRTASKIAFHCDAADVVGLLCLATGRRGGESRLASSAAIYNALLDRRPDLIGRMYEPFWLDAHGQRGMSRVRVPLARHAAGRLRLFYHSDYFRSGGAQSPNGLDREARELVDLFDELANSNEYCLSMQLRPGDIQLVSNHSVVHARSAYEDGSLGPEQQRHLLRLWLSLESEKGLAARYQKARAWAGTLTSMASSLASSFSSDSSADAASDRKSRSRTSGKRAGARDNPDGVRGNEKAHG